MSSISIRYALLMFSSLALVAVSTPSVSLKLIDSVKNEHTFQVAAIVQNTGDETLKLLNDVKSVLSKMPTDSFTISSPRGAPRFTGIKAKYVQEQVVRADDPQSFTVLAPGEMATVVHDLSEAYDFSHQDKELYTIKARNLLYYVEPQTSSIHTLYADSHGHNTSISGLTQRKTQTTKEGSSYNGCTDLQQADLSAAAPNAQKYADDALSYLKAHKSTTTRYGTWFGSYDEDRHSTVLSHFSRMDGNQYSELNFDCTCTDPDTFAYVYPDQYGVVYLCGAFWKAPATGTDSKAGTLVHESSHFTENGGTDDIVYGQSACRQLATSDPARATDNADSHEYFAENNPSRD